MQKYVPLVKQKKLDVFILGGQGIDHKRKRSRERIEKGSRERIEKGSRERIEIER